MRVVRMFAWACVLAIATAVMLVFTAPLLPSPVNLADAAAQRTAYAAGAFAVALVCVIGSLLLLPLWRRELAALRPARIGLVTFVIAAVATAAGWTAFGALAWNVVAPLPRRTAEGAATAATVTAVWFAAITLLTAYGLWSTVRSAALRPVLASAVGEGGLRTVTGVVRAHTGAVQLVDPVTLRPSVAWVLDVEEDYWHEERYLTSDPFSSAEPKVERKTHTSHKRRAGVARCTTTFLIDGPFGSLFCDDPAVRVFPTAKVTWEEGDPPLPPLPEDIADDLRRRNLLDARFGSRSISLGDTVTGVGLIVIAEDGVVELRASPSVTPRFWLSPLHGIRAHVAPASRRAAQRLQSAARTA